MTPVIFEAQCLVLTHVAFQKGKVVAAEYQGSWLFCGNEYSPRYFSFYVAKKQATVADNLRH